MASLAGPVLSEPPLAVAPRSQRVVLAFAVVVATLHVVTAGVPDVYDELPGQYASTAWEMVESGTWLVPTLEGVPRLQKPPPLLAQPARRNAGGGHGAQRHLRAPDQPLRAR